ncbi:hypothetical protein [Deinococcus soli (ex Cha et al. 2016)]|uniref:hypothetical protein n=1 Tax=Deinococcus soli (ex Cha et al. 2016) TaxID=1309411 RepID=UPI001669B8FB|nr:hypothetical protein [Deinococcus soli (ex Cha et al. 2016)]GGB76388.1 hypothetical protein GCM10008019_35730 [Deinococcus soli (ex Cha et al. 2016)]
MSAAHYGKQVIDQLRHLLGDVDDLITYEHPTLPDVDFALVRFRSCPDRYFTAGLSDDLYDKVELTLAHDAWSPGLQDVFAYIGTYVAVKGIHVFSGVNISNLEVSTAQFGYPDIGGCVFRANTRDGTDLMIDVTTSQGAHRALPIYDTVLLSPGEAVAVARGNNPYLDP